MKQEVKTIGDRVFCDWSCNKEYTHSPAKGGLLFGSYAVCPECAPDVEAKAVKNQEENRIRARCPEGMSFRDWVVNVLRKNKPGTITTTVFKSFEEFKHHINASRNTE